MDNNNEEMSAEEFKLRLLKQQIGVRYGEYEDAIATLQTQLYIAEQKIREYEEAAKNETIQEEGARDAAAS